MDLPPLDLMVLDSVVDEWETIETMRDHGEVAPHGLALVDLDLVVDAVRSLVTAGLLEVREVDAAGLTLVPVRTAGIDDASLMRYWFRPSDAGRTVWRDGGGTLEIYWDAYWAAHPDGGSL